MSTNPNNAVGTNGAYGGRTSVNALNDNLAAYSRGIMSGWACSPNSGLTVSLGGDGTTRDVAIAEDNAGNKTTINNISGSPIDVTLSAAPASNSRIDLVVAYVDNPPQGTNTETDNPGACGIIAVSGNVALSPTVPDDSAIRTAITADGASGTTAYYVVLASITIASGTTTITNTNITQGTNSGISEKNIDFENFSASDLNFKHYTKKTISLGYGVSVTLARIGNLVVIQGTSIMSNALPTVETSLAETIPAGYKPISVSSINAICGSETGKYATWWVSINGELSLIATGFTGASTRRVNVSSAWITQDEWPTN